MGRPCDRARPWYPTILHHLPFRPGISCAGHTTHLSRANDRTSEQVVRYILICLENEERLARLSDLHAEWGDMWRWEVVGQTKGDSFLPSSEDLELAESDMEGGGGEGLIAILHVSSVSPLSCERNRTWSTCRTTITSMAPESVAGLMPESMMSAVRGELRAELTVVVRLGQVLHVARMAEGFATTVWRERQAVGAVGERTDWQLPQQGRVWVRELLNVMYDMWL